MNTPAHAVLNLALLERGRDSSVGLWVVGGAVAPDIPNASFFAYHRYVQGLDAATIYAHLYPLPQWQAVLAPAHSIWLVFVVLAVARWRNHAGGIALGLSIAAHLMGDLLTHGADAHPHLYPLSELRFRSPVSYWDAAAGARWFVPLELVAVVIASFRAWRGGVQWWRRALLVGSCVWLAGSYAAGWAFWGTA